MSTRSKIARTITPFRSLFQRRSLNLRVRHVDLRARGLNLGTRIVLASDMHARNDWFPQPLIAQTVD
ncbi:MAG: hypothetical protein ABI200_06140, partial [Gaiellales bacterium]